MIELDFPHKSKRIKHFNDDIGDFWTKNPESKFNQFNENVRKLWEYLNKMTWDNYEKIKNSIMTKF